MPLPAVPLVERPDVPAVEEMHSRPERLRALLDEQMVVVGQKAPAETAPTTGARDIAEQTEEEPAVGVVPEHRGSVVSARRDVAIRAGLVKARLTRHRPTVP